MNIPEQILYWQPFNSESKRSTTKYNQIATYNCPNSTENVLSISISWNWIEMKWNEIKFANDNKNYVNKESTNEGQGW